VLVRAAASLLAPPRRAAPRAHAAPTRADPSQPTDQDTLVFKLHVRGVVPPPAAEKSAAAAAAAAASSSSAPAAPAGMSLSGAEGGSSAVEQAVYLREFAEAAEREGDVDGRYTKVYARDLTWEAHGAQEEMFPGLGDDVGAVQGDILVAKLAPGQTISLEAHAVKGTGKTHAKWSPVSTAWYRLAPRIALSAAEPFVGADADALVASCPAKVFDIEDAGARRRGVVARPRDCTLCRECIRDPARAPRISLEQVSNHFICEGARKRGRLRAPRPCRVPPAAPRPPCHAAAASSPRAPRPCAVTVESTGALPARDLVVLALDILREKCAKVATAFDAALASETRGLLDASAVTRATIAAMRTTSDDLASRH
jgi:hypothetical protein